MKNIFSTFSLSKARNQRIIESIEDYLEEDMNKTNTDYFRINLMLEEKKYNLNNMNKIKINNIEISVEEFKRLAKENEALLKEPDVKGRYFFPKVGDVYWFINSWEGIKYNFNDSVFDKENISAGNCYRTKEEAELALKKQQAIVRCWKWQQENAYFEPDWVDNHQRKYFYKYCSKNRCYITDYDFLTKSQFSLPYFKSEEDVGSFIEANKEDLLLLFTK